jgi:predicted transposase YdaD
MHEYDATLKLLLEHATDSLLTQVTGVKVARWLNVEMPQVQTRRADLLGATASGGLVHVELQSGNESDMALRMAEYALRIYRQFRKFPRQIVLYVGEPEVRMNAAWNEPDFSFRYTLIDIRNLDGAALLESSRIEDNVVAILTRLQDRASAVRKILARIASLEEPARRYAFAQFLIISGLRKLSSSVKEEAQKMPILNDILEHEVIGPAILQGRREGHQEGRCEMVRRLLEKRFGPIPAWVEPRLAALSSSELDDAALRLLDATRIEEVFPGNPATFLPQQ